MSAISISSLPDRFLGTIVEDAVRILNKLENREELEKIMREFRKKYPRVKKLPCKKVEKAFKWLARRICRAFGVAPPDDIVVASKKSLRLYMGGMIVTDQSIISFLHELYHHIFFQKGITHNDWDAQKYAIATYLLGYFDLLPKLELRDNYYLVWKG